MSPDYVTGAKHSVRTDFVPPLHRKFSAGASERQQVAQREATASMERTVIGTDGLLMTTGSRSATISILTMNALQGKMKLIFEIFLSAVANVVCLMHYVLCNVNRYSDIFKSHLACVCVGCKCEQDTGGELRRNASASGTFAIANANRCRRWVALCLAHIHVYDAGGIGAMTWLWLMFEHEHLNHALCVCVCSGYRCKSEAKRHRHDMSIELG